MGVYSRTITNRGICTTRGSHSVIIKDLYCEVIPPGGNVFLNKFICFIGEEMKTENFIKYSGPGSTL